MIDFIDFSHYFFCLNFLSLLFFVLCQGMCTLYVMIPRSQIICQMYNLYNL